MRWYRCRSSSTALWVPGNTQSPYRHWCQIHRCPLTPPGPPSPVHFFRLQCRRLTRRHLHHFFGYPASATRPTIAVLRTSGSTAPGDPPLPAPLPAPVPPVDPPLPLLLSLSPLAPPGLPSPFPLLQAPVPPAHPPLLAPQPEASAARPPTVYPSVPHRTDTARKKEGVL